MPKRRIMDERTGGPCDYRALAKECRALAEDEELTWRRAAERVAKAANAVEYDSVVRNLNRYREDHPKSAQPSGILPGEAVLYEAVEGWLTLLETKASGLIEHDRDYPPGGDGPYAAVATEAAQLRTLLEGRLAVLRNLPPESASRAALYVLGGKDLGPLTPEKLLQEEHARLGSLFGRVRHLQNRVQEARPGPKVIEDF